MNADSIKVETDEDGFWLEIEDGDPSALHQPGRYRFRISDPEALYDHVKAAIGPWLYERDQAKRERGTFIVAPGWDQAAGYDISDPKHPDYHSIHADIWDAREGK